MEYPWLITISLCLVLHVLRIHTVLGCEDCSVNSRATYYGSPDCLATAGGACGYGSFGRNMNGGDAAAVAQLYRNGTGCGACYQVRCTDDSLCALDGVKIVVTDYGQGDRTDFILSAGAYSKLARVDKAKELMARGVIDIEYKRVSCEYRGYNLVFKIDENSNFPDYLALLFYYQAGKKDVLAVDLCQEQSYEWKAMCRSHGAVWDIVIPPRGTLSLRFLISDGYRQEWITVANVIPQNWKPGAVYDSGIQLYY